VAYENILYETTERLAFITLNRPEKLNPLSSELRGELFHALKEAEANRSIGVIVLRGAGRAFCSGYDLAPSRGAGEPSPFVNPHSRLPDTNTTHPAHYDWSRHVLLGNWIIWELAKPVVAQIQGYCLAGGTELATFCDFRIVAEDAQIGYPPVRAMGTMDIMWAPWHLPMTKAREFAYIGDSFSGRDMAQMGWATYAVPADELAEFTERFARRMANIDNDMLMYSKRSVNRQYEAMGIRNGLMSGTDVEAMSKHRPAAQEWNRRLREEGLKAALEWRDGPFRDFRGARTTAPKERPVAGAETEGQPKNPDRAS
jgi:enoyl-CoA hydratase